MSAPALSNPVEAMRAAASDRLRADARAIDAGVRTPSDYAIEFGEYLAEAAERYARIAQDVPQTVAEIDSLRDAHAGLQSAIYEFRKRVGRVQVDKVSERLRA